jgi:hypothetical protein
LKIAPARGESVFYQPMSFGGKMEREQGKEKQSKDRGKYLG